VDPSVGNEGFFNSLIRSLATLGFKEDLIDSVYSIVFLVSWVLMVLSVFGSSEDLVGRRSGSVYRANLDLAWCFMASVSFGINQCDVIY